VTGAFPTGSLRGPRPAAGSRLRLRSGARGRGREFEKSALDLTPASPATHAAVGVFLTLTPPTKPMVAEAATGQFEEDAMRLHDRAVARRDDAFKRAPREQVSQGKRDL
jgi:hypothetical protein